MAWRKTARCWYKRPAACRPSPAPTSACGRCASELPTPGPNTMLRLAVILLLLANPGHRPPPDPPQPLPPGPAKRPPPPTAHRVAASTASTASGQTPDASAECLRAGVFDEQQADALRTAAAAGLP